MLYFSYSVALITMDRITETIGSFSDEEFRSRVDEYLMGRAAFPQEKGADNIIGKFGKLMAEKVRNTTRWQVQLHLFGESLLTVLTTCVYDPIITCMLHPVYGIEGIRQPPNSEFSYPIFLPSVFQPDRLGEMKELNNTLCYLHHLHRTHSTWPGSKHEAISKFYFRLLELNPNFWSDFGLPEKQIPVKCVRANAKPGDIIIWQVYHGSGWKLLNSDGPCMATFVDLTHRNKLTPEERAIYYRRMLAGPFQCGAGSGRHEGDNYLFRKSRGETGGLLTGLTGEDQLTPLARYINGDDRVDAPTNLPKILSDDQMAKLKQDGYFVLSLRDHPLFGVEWNNIVSDLKREFMEYFNWTLFGSEPEFSRLSLSLEDTKNPVWALISGKRSEAKTHLGDEYGLYKFSEKENRRTHNPQNGGTKLAGDSGFGAAANVYDLPSQRKLVSSIPIFSLMSQLYGTTELLHVPERFRIKSSNNLLKIHVDKVFDLDEMLLTKSAKKRKF